MKETMVEVRGLTFSYKPGREILSDVGFTLHKGDVLSILGANGAGKSTLFNCLCGLLAPDKGEILFKGRNLADITITGLSLLLGYVPQMSGPDFSYSVRDYLVMGRAPHMHTLAVPGRAEYEKVDAVLEKLEIGHLANKAFSEISGGERQQAQIARVLVQESEIVLMDEPTNHLDYGNQFKILRLISELSAAGMTIIMTTHMPDHAMLMEGKVGILDREGHLAVGAPLDILTEGTLKKIYNTQLHLVFVEEVGRMACLVDSFWKQPV